MKEEHKCPCSIVIGPGPDDYGRNTERNAEAMKKFIKLRKRKKRFAKSLRSLLSREGKNEF